MKYLKTFNESVISGEDFLYKQISSDEYFRFDDTHNTINIEKETRDSISNLIKTDKKSEYKQKIGEFSYKISVMKSSVKYKEEDIILFRQYEDNWFIIWDNKEDGEISRFLLCDGFEGVEKYINDEVNTRYIKESVVDGDDFLYKRITTTECDEFTSSHSKHFISDDDDENTLNRLHKIITKKIEEDLIVQSLSERRTSATSFKFKIEFFDYDYLYFYRYEDEWFIVVYIPSEGNQYSCLCDSWEGVESFVNNEVDDYGFSINGGLNESVFEGEDFLYKEIDYDEFEEIDLNKTRVVPDEITMDKIYDLVKLKTDYDVDKSLVDDDTGFYNFEILCDDGTDIRVISLEDDWYLLCLSENIGKILASFIVSYYICDGWEGLEKFIDDKI